MVKKIIIHSFIAIILTGCCYNGKVSDYGLPRREIKKLDRTILYGAIDTLALYKLTNSFHFNSLSKEYTFLEKDIYNSYPNASYLKFYPNGKLGLFIIPKTDTLKLERSFFDPQRAKMGYYYINGNSIKTRISAIGDCSLYLSNKKGTIENDKILINDNSGHGNIYIKKEVPKVILENWKPDW